jgi:hypothetical protein
VATYQIPAPLNDPVVQELERERFSLSGTPPAYYIRVTIDNKKGQGPFGAMVITIQAADGSSVVPLTAGILLKQWANAAHPGESLARWFHLADESRFSGQVGKGGTGTAILVVTESLRGIRSVTHTTNGSKLELLPGR